MWQAEQKKLKNNAGDISESYFDNLKEHGASEEEIAKAREDMNVSSPDEEDEGYDKVEVIK